MEADKTWVISYDNAGNILRKREYPYTTATYPSGEPAYYLNNYNRDRISGVYYHKEWSTGDGDFVHTQTYDSLGNPLSYKNLKGVYSYNFTWINGRQLASTVTQYANSSYTYDADGYRLTRTVNGVEYKYIWIDGLLMCQTWGNEIMIFLYDEVGSPIGFGYRYGSGDSYDYYYYEKNLQGDIVGIFNQSGTRIVEYTYDAWGESQGMSGQGAYPIGFNNPFRYRGYYFDYETNLYYLQSRYYDPVNGRFLNADGEMSGVGTYEGYNLYSYCFNDPVNYYDDAGRWPHSFSWRIDEKGTPNEHIHIEHNGNKYTGYRNSGNKHHGKEKGLDELSKSQKKELRKRGVPDDYFKDDDDKGPPSPPTPPSANIPNANPAKNKDKRHKCEWVLVQEPISTTQMVVGGLLIVGGIVGSFFSAGGTSPVAVAGAACFIPPMPTYECSICGAKSLTPF